MNFSEFSRKRSLATRLCWAFE